MKNLLLILALCLAACGPSGGDSPGSTPRSLALFAGSPEGGGSLDGAGSVAEFNFPFGVASDLAGNLSVTDSGNNTVRKITPAGTVTTFAGTAGVGGSTNATGAAARFNAPAGVTAVDSAGNIYVADSENHTIRRITSTGAVTTLAGTAGVAGFLNATGTAALFNGPRGVALDAAGNVYVADTDNHIIRRITPAGVVTTFAGAAGVANSTNGSAATARFNLPAGIATDSAGNVYVADLGNSTIRKLTPAGDVSTLAGTAGSTGSTDDIGALARFSFPNALAVDLAGNVYVADTQNHTVRKITPLGVVTTLAGTAGLAGNAGTFGAAARFRFPFGIAVDGTGSVYVADAFNQGIRKITAAGFVTTLAGASVAPGSADGTGAAARFNSPQGAAADAAGNVYVADELNHTIRKITPGGVVTTLAGAANVPGSANGASTVARFSGPKGVAADAAGNVYVADSANHTIRKITSGGVVTTLAGTAGVAGGADGTGAAARFTLPNGVAVDGAGNVYVADGGNHAIRKVTSLGVVTTLAGSAGLPGSADGTGSAARFRFPSGVAVDGAGNVYVTDNENHTIRKITPAGVVSTLAGSAGVAGSADGTGAAARFNFPEGVAVDSAGNVYVADTNNSTIRKITPAGVVTTVVGVAGQATFAEGVLPGRLGFPRGLALNRTLLYVTLYDGVAIVRNVP